VLFVVSGSGTIGGEMIAAQASIEIEPGKAEALQADTSLTVLMMQLPKIVAQTASASLAA
jgi:hypothetical protein